MSDTGKNRGRKKKEPSHSEDELSRPWVNFYDGSNPNGTTAEVGVGDKQFNALLKQALEQYKKQGGQSQA